MTATQPPGTAGAALWRAGRRAARALRAVHEEQVLMWDLLWQASRVPAGHAGPLAWRPSLDGPRLTGSHLPTPGEVSTGGTR
jgi:hypothetical protein